MAENLTTPPMEGDSKQNGKAARQNRGRRSGSRYLRTVVLVAAVAGPLAFLVMKSSVVVDNDSLRPTGELEKKSVGFDAVARNVPPARAPAASTPSVAYARSVDLQSLSVSLQQTTARLEEIALSLDELNIQQTRTAQQIEEIKRDLSRASARRQARSPKRTRHNINAAAAQTNVVRADARKSTVRILSVDTWEGKPSVSVAQDEGLRFITEGDSIGRYTLRTADRSEQRTSFSTPEGRVVEARTISGGEE